MENPEKIYLVTEWVFNNRLVAIKKILNHMCSESKNKLMTELSLQNRIYSIPNKQQNQTSLSVSPITPEGLFVKKPVNSQEC